MVRVKNYEIMSTVVKVMPIKYHWFNFFSRRGVYRVVQKSGTRVLILR